MIVPFLLAHHEATPHHTRHQLILNMVTLSTMWLVLALERFAKSAGCRAVLKRQARPRAARRLVGSFCRERTDAKYPSPDLTLGINCPSVFPEVCKDYYRHQTNGITY